MSQSQGPPQLPVNERDRSRSPPPIREVHSHNLTKESLCPKCLSRDRYTRTCDFGKRCCCEVRCSRCRNLFAKTVRGIVVR